MGKKKDQRRAMEAARAQAAELEPPDMTAPERDDGELVQISMVLTRGDRLRLRKLGLVLDNLSLQRMGHRAWNGFLEGHGLPKLTPVLVGTQGRQPPAGED